MKETYFFSHDHNARTDPKIKKLLRVHEWAGYGIFWALIEDLYNNDNCLDLDYDLIAYDLRVEVDLVKSVINDFELFAIDGNTFGSTSIQKRLDERDEKSKKARASVRKRWAKQKEQSEKEEEKPPEFSAGNTNEIRTYYENNTFAIRTDDEGNTIYIYNIDNKDKYIGKDINNNKPTQSIFFPYRNGVMAAKNLYEVDIGKLQTLKLEVKGITDEKMEFEFNEIKRWISSRNEDTWPTAYGMMKFIRKWLINSLKENKKQGNSKNGNDESSIEKYRANRAAFIASETEGDPDNST